MKRAVVLALAAQTAIVAAVAAPRLLVRLTGTEYRLAVRPVDPVDPFRGAYVRLGYTGFDAAQDLGGRVYVPLVREGDHWVGSGYALRARPESGPYVACESDGQLSCGIESFFASQRRAAELERTLADGAVAIVRVSGSGRAVVVGLEG